MKKLFPNELFDIFIRRRWPGWPDASYTKWTDLSEWDREQFCLHLADVADKIDDAVKFLEEQGFKVTRD